MVAIEKLLVAPVATGQVGLPGGTRVEVFQQIFWVFLVLGTLVGTVVISYALYNAYKYRHGSEHSKEAPEDERPKLGEIPTGGGGGRKLALSFTLSAIIVLSLIIWTYGMLLYVETAPAQEQDALEIHVESYQFDFAFTYPNGHKADDLRVPKGQMVKLKVTSSDVFHTFGVPGLRVKADAIPGQTTESWFIAEETGTYGAACYELCGAGHSYMTSEVIVMEPDAYDEWYANTTAS